MAVALASHPIFWPYPSTQSAWPPILIRYDTSPTKSRGMRRQNSVVSSRTLSAQQQPIGHVQDVFPAHVDCCDQDNWQRLLPGGCGAAQLQGQKLQGSADRPAIHPRWSESHHLIFRGGKGEGRGAVSHYILTAAWLVVSLEAKSYIACPWSIQTHEAQR